MLWNIYGPCTLLLLLKKELSQCAMQKGKFFRPEKLLEPLAQIESRDESFERSGVRKQSGRAL